MQIKEKKSKLRATGLCAGNSPMTGEFPAQGANNAENVSIWLRHHVALSVRYHGSQFPSWRNGTSNQQNNVIYSKMMFAVSTSSVIYKDENQNEMDQVTNDENVNHILVHKSTTFFSFSMHFQVSEVVLSLPEHQQWCVSFTAINNWKICC